MNAYRPPSQPGRARFRLLASGGISTPIPSPASACINAQTRSHEPSSRRSRSPRPRPGRPRFRARAARRTGPPAPSRDAVKSAKSSCGRAPDWRRSRAWRRPQSSAARSVARTVHRSRTRTPTSHHHRRIMRRPLSVTAPDRPPLCATASSNRERDRYRQPALANARDIVPSDRPASLCLARRAPDDGARLLDGRVRALAACARSHARAPAAPGPRPGPAMSLVRLTRAEARFTRWAASRGTGRSGKQPGGMLSRVLSRLWHASAPVTTKAPYYQGFRRCAEEDSNLHPVIPDQALNLARLPIPPSARGLAEYSRGVGARSASRGSRSRSISGRRAPAARRSDGDSLRELNS